MTITRETESKIRSIFRDAMESACEKLAEKETIDVYWPDGFAERLAEMATQAIAMMAESCAMASDE